MQRDLSMVDGVTTALRTVHLIFAAAWVGSVLFVTFGLLPVARDGDLDAAPTQRILIRLINLSRICALVLLLTGGHLLMTVYGLDGMTATLAGHLVVGMVGLWIALIGVIEVSVARMTDELRAKKVRSPARAFRPWFYAASVIGVLALIDAGLITAVR